MSDPTNIARLRLVQGQLSEYDQRRPYSDLLGFRNSVIPILRAARQLCQDNGRWVTPGVIAEQEELVHYAVFFINPMYHAPNIGSEVAQQLAESIDSHIKAHDKDQLGEAERLCSL